MASPKRLILRSASTDGAAVEQKQIARHSQQSELFTFASTCTGTLSTGPFRIVKASRSLQGSMDGSLSTDSSLSDHVARRLRRPETTIPQGRRRFPEPEIGVDMGLQRAADRRHG